MNDAAFEEFLSAFERASVSQQERFALLLDRWLVQPPDGWSKTQKKMWALGWARIVQLGDNMTYIYGPDGVTIIETIVRPFSQTW